eukprot:gene1484-2111_t
MTVVKEVQDTMDPSVFSALRFGLASLFFLPMMPAALGDASVRRMGLELGTISGLAYCAQAVGLLSTDASQASFLSAFTVIVVPLLAGLTGKKITATTWGACVVSITGVMMLEAGGSPPTMGDAWILLSAFLFGMHIFRTEHHTKQLQAQQRMQLTGLQLTVIAVLAAAFGIAEHSSTILADSTLWSVSSAASLLGRLPWPELFYTGLVSTAGCLWIELTALENVEAVDAAIIYTLEPLWGAGFAWLMLGERWGPEGWIGAALIMSGCLAAQLGQQEGEGKLEALSSNDSLGQHNDWAHDGSTLHSEDALSSNDFMSLHNEWAHDGSTCHSENEALSSDDFMCLHNDWAHDGSTRHSEDPLDARKVGSAELEILQHTGIYTRKSVKIRNSEKSSKSAALDRN